MAEFKRKPMAEELTAALKAGVRDIPSAIVEPSVRWAESVKMRRQRDCQKMHRQAFENLVQELSNLGPTPFIPADWIICTDSDILRDLRTQFVVQEWSGLSSATADKTASITGFSAAPNTSAPPS